MQHESDIPEDVTPKDQDDARYMTMYLQHVDMMKTLSAIAGSLEAMQQEGKENKSFASFTYNMVIVLVVVAALSIAAVFILSR